MTEVANGKKASPLTMEGVKAWIPLLLIVISLVTGWVTMGTQIRQTQIDVARLRYEYDLSLSDVVAVKAERNEQYLLISVQLAAINVTLKYIQTEIEKLEAVK